MPNCSYRKIFISTLGIALICASQIATANLTIDASYTGFTADQQATLQSCVNFFEHTYTNNVTVVIDFSAMSGGLGESTTYYGNEGYQSVYNSLSANANSSIQLQSVASLPNQATDPVLGQADVRVMTADLKALGMLGNGATPFDGQIGLNTSICFTNSQGPLTGKYMLQAVAEHEMDEVMGGGGAGSTIGDGTAYAGMTDLFRYSADGVRSYTTDPSATSYLSADGGKSVINYFNESGGGSDYGDWAGSKTPHVQDAYGSPGMNVAYGTDELDMMQMVGWNVAAVPEPSSVAAFGVLGLGLLVRRRVSGKRSR